MENLFTFDIPANQKSIIKVIGVGGGGSNAVNYMHSRGIKDVEFIVCNTDVQALKSSPVANRLAIGTNLTGGLGAGTKPETGRQAAIEDKENIREALTNTKMLFVTAGMGGGTGTGAAPVIAKIAREMDILTVGIVTIPFHFEGKRKVDIAQQGIAEMKQFCDTVIVICNDKIREMFGNLSMQQAFYQADDILATAAKSIAEIITMAGYLNIDFADVEMVMKEAGTAVMGSGIGKGDNRGMKAAEMALNSPLLNNTSIRGAKRILVSIMSADPDSITMDEFGDINDYFQTMAGEDAVLKSGICNDSGLEDNIRVTVIATGFEGEELAPANERKVIDLETNKQLNFYNQNTYKFEPTVEGKPAYQPENRVAEQRITEEKVATEIQQARIIFEIDGQPQASPSQPMADGKAEADRLNEERRTFLNKQAEERINRLKNLGSSYMMPNEFKEKLEIPAFLRKNVPLQDVPHSSERNISRLYLNDDNEMLGNNKFLHDNVD
jgi:cell division protein FtsZ